MPEELKDIRFTLPEVWDYDSDIAALLDRKRPFRLAKLRGRCRDRWTLDSDWEDFEVTPFQFMVFLASGYMRIDNLDAVLQVAREGGVEWAGDCKVIGAQILADDRERVRIVVIQKGQPSQLATVLEEEGFDPAMYEGLTAENFFEFMEGLYTEPAEDWPPPDWGMEGDPIFGEPYDHPETGE